MKTWDGDDYQARFDRIAASGTAVHGEVDFVMRFDPASVLDAGCGTGRVAIELAARGVDVVGVDLDASMLSTAKRRAPQVAWVESDLCALDLNRRFDVVVAAGNVVLFTPDGTQRALIARCAAHVASAGYLVLGYSLGRGYSLAQLDGHAHDAGLHLVDRFATWDADVFIPSPQADYAVSVFAATEPAP